MTEVVELALKLFLSNPYDPPAKLFQLAAQFVDYKNQYEDGTVNLPLQVPQQSARQSHDRQYSDVEKNGVGF